MCALVRDFYLPGPVFIHFDLNSSPDLKEIIFINSSKASILGSRI
jgi:hypothetical protein